MKLPPLTGVIVSVSGQDNEVGRWGSSPNYLPRAFKPAGIECPYCHEELKEIISAAAQVRLVKMLPNNQALGHTLPETHRAVGCFACKQGFSVPR